ncbi:MAG: hypothetical protein ACT4O4_03495 [Nitrospiraceae bacterium]
MKISTSWGTGKGSRKRKRTVSKTKIRWDLLGLQDPGRMASTPSMEDIRSQIISMSSQGLGAASRSDVKNVSGHSATNAAASTRKRRRGATS